MGHRKEARTLPCETHANRSQRHRPKKDPTEQRRGPKPRPHRGPEPQGERVPTGNGREATGGAAQQAMPCQLR
eukprot:10042271-Alexandrium_andersonii.AAC.1